MPELSFLVVREILKESERSEWFYMFYGEKNERKINKK